MKKIAILFCISMLMFSCSSGDSIDSISNIIIGNWSLKSQKVNNVETITSCTEQTNFTFDTNSILTQNFYTETNGVCTNSSSLVFSWVDMGNSVYRITYPDGTTRNLTLTFSQNNQQFSVSETNASNENVVSVFSKN